LIKKCFTRFLGNRGQAGKLNALAFARAFIF